MQINCMENINLQTRRFRKHFHLCLDLFPFSFFITDNSVGSCEANFHSKAVVYIYTKSIRCNEKIKFAKSAVRRSLNFFIAAERL